MTEVERASKLKNSPIPTKWEWLRLYLGLFLGALIPTIIVAGLLYIVVVPYYYITGSDASLQENNLTDVLANPFLFVSGVFVYGGGLVFQFLIKGESELTRRTIDQRTKEYAEELQKVEEEREENEAQLQRIEEEK